MINANQLLDRIKKAGVKKQQSADEAAKYIANTNNTNTLPIYKSGYWQGYLDALEDIDKENVLDWSQK